MIRHLFTLFALLSCAVVLSAAPAFDVWSAKPEIRSVESNTSLKLTGQREGDFYRARLTNSGAMPIHVREVALFRISHDLPDETALYGESFQMLSQTAGTLGKPLNLGYDELAHYKLPQPADAKVVSGMMTLTPPASATLLLGFTSCRRFNGRFYLRPKSIEVVLDTEGLAIAPGETWDLEEFLFTTGSDRAALLTRLADRIDRNHPPLRFEHPPAGWCSWYCFGARVTARNVMDNLSAIAKDVPQLKYVQLDDGYQPAMGDWLETGNAFGGDVQGVLQAIRRQGFEPAIWVAPFIAEAGSHLFHQHPDWFMKGDDGKPLSADKVTFQGWRRGPWYALDGTNPEVQKHLENVFRTMRKDWGVTYFKLDANFWGAMHGGHLHDPHATRIEAYRRGMEAVLRGAGDSFILGCNHPIWASFGLIHGSRSSGDIKRSWDTFQKVARQNLNRNWQNGRLWWNDPDALTLSGTMPAEEYRFHATAVLASGGLVLSGDDLSTLPPDRLATLKKLLPPTGVAAEFADENLRVGVVHLKDRSLVCVFNWGEEAQKIPVKLPHAGNVADLWSGHDYGPQKSTLDVSLQPHEGTVLVLR
ncbi:MAG TPA: glycoside hydrolase family 36 protein [Bryobacteraceae bacterium]|nr:glycoside hydrolase family 36 protein [Bryobacteraceae bacterium]